MSNHPIVHVEFSSKDQKADAKFYAELFGWKMEHVDEMNYTTFETGENPGGGLAPVGDNMTAGATLAHVYTDDIDATLAKAVSLGGKKITPKTEIPGFGWFGLFQDPSGNVVGLYTPMPGGG